MAKETFWFSHDHNSRSDRKMLNLRMKHGMEGVGVYWCIVEMLYEENGYISHGDYERIAFELQTNIERITSVINDFDLFDKNSDNFWSNSAINRLKIRKNKSESAKESVRIRWELEKKRKEDTNVLQSNYDSNTIKNRIEENNNTNTSIVKHKEKNEKKESSIGTAATSGVGILISHINAGK